MSEQYTHDQLISMRDTAMTKLYNFLVEIGALTELRRSLLNEYCQTETAIKLEHYACLGAFLSECEMVEWLLDEFYASRPVVEDFGEPS